MLHVTRDIGVRTTYHGSAQLVSGEIAEDLAAYFATSEQIPSVVALGVLVAPDLHVLASGGLCVQVLPGASMDVIVDLETRARQIPPITQMVAEGCTPEQVLQTALGGLEPQIAAVSPVAFQCRCSRQRVEEMLCGLGVRELEALLAQEGRAEVTCRFCGDRYVLTQSDVQALITGLRNGQAPVM
jgi:molecular chaperone Hsp33